jgi:hypothetical protein
VTPEAPRVLKGLAIPLWYAPGPARQGPTWPLDAIMNNYDVTPRRHRIPLTKLVAPVGLVVFYACLIWYVKRDLECQADQYSHC